MYSTVVVYFSKQKKDEVSVTVSGYEISRDGVHGNTGTEEELHDLSKQNKKRRESGKYMSH